CDWYLEIAKPRLYNGDRDAAANLLWVLRQVLALAHPMMPFVTEEIWSYARRPGDAPLVVSPYPRADEALLDEDAERELGRWIELTRGVRRWRDLAGVAAGSVLPARVARLELGNGDGEAVATIGPLEIIATEGLDAKRVRARLAERREALRSEVERAERKLANEGFVTKAPPEVVEAERYLASLEPIGWRFGLDRMRRLVSLLGMPQHRFASVHVVGTNGKSSVTAMVAALLEAHGRAAGAYLSPHAERWSQRVIVRRSEIGREPFARAVERVAEAVPVVNRALEEGDFVTQFEAATAVAFVALAQARVEFGVIEAGLGGRLDATNVLPSRVTVLTSIGLEHTQWLGDTEELI